MRSKVVVDPQGQRWKVSLRQAKARTGPKPPLTTRRALGGIVQLLTLRPRAFGYFYQPTWIVMAENDRGKKHRWSTGLTSRKEAEASLNEVVDRLAKGRDLVTGADPVP